MNHHTASSIPDNYTEYINSPTLQIPEDILEDPNFALIFFDANQPIRLVHFPPSIRKNHDLIKNLMIKKPVIIVYADRNLWSKLDLYLVKMDFTDYDYTCRTIRDFIFHLMENLDYDEYVKKILEDVKKINRIYASMRTRYNTIRGIEED